MNPLPQSDLTYISEHLENHFNLLNKKTILIAGGTGFFGKWLVESLDFMNVEKKMELNLVLISRDIKKAQSQYGHIQTNIDYIEFDLTGDKKLSYDKQIDYVIHSGNDAVWPKNPEQEIHQYKCIVGGTEKLLDFSVKNNISRFLYVSSGAADSAFDVNNKSQRIYSESKRMAEILTLAYGAQGKFSTSIARCYSFIGPYLPLDKHYAIGNFLKNAVEGKNIEIQSDGGSVRSYLYAADLALWLLTILLFGKNEAVYNVGSNEAITIKELAEKILIHFPKSELNVLNTSSNKSIYLPDVEKTLNDLELPKPISLDLSMQKTISWLKK